MSVIESARQQRFERELARCKNDLQRKRFTSLHENGLSAWVATRTGKRVVSAFKKYVTTMDPAAIDEGLYHWSMHDGPGDIAHYNLHGYRSVYWHPALYLELILMPWLEREPRLHTIYVYTDGMTSRDVMIAIRDLARTHRSRVVEKFAALKRERELAEARELAAKYGMKVVPE